VNNNFEVTQKDAVVASFATLSKHVYEGTEGKYVIPESAVFAAQLSAMFDFEILNTKSLRFFNPLTPELNPSAQRCLTRFFTGDFAS
jgi:hypothetical protein